MLSDNKKEGEGYFRYLQTKKGESVSAKDHCVLLLKSLYDLL
jgi:Reverse transcriptase (RNA-dependent DNA polymerase)